MGVHTYKNLTTLCSFWAMKIIRNKNLDTSHPWAKGERNVIWHNRSGIVHILTSRISVFNIIWIKSNISTISLNKLCTNTTHYLPLHENNKNNEAALKIRFWDLESNHLIQIIDNSKYWPLGGLQGLGPYHCWLKIYFTHTHPDPPLKSRKQQKL